MQTLRIVFQYHKRDTLAFIVHTCTFMAVSQCASNAPPNAPPTRLQMRLQLCLQRASNCPSNAPPISHDKALSYMK